MTQRSSFLFDPWALDKWQADFGNRLGLDRELVLLEHVFPVEWLEALLGTLPPKHGLPYHLLMLGGRARLLHLAAELLRYVGAGEVAGYAKVPLGRLRERNLYPPTAGEFLVAPILRPVGAVKPQPQGRGHGADYMIDLSSGALVAEVKRLCTARRQERAAMDRVLADPERSGPIFTESEERFNAQEDGRRLYPHVKHAASQLGASARAVTVGERGPAIPGGVPGILFLDRDGNSLLANVHSRIVEWMRLSWAASIDLVVFFDFDSCGGTWRTVVELVFSRTGRAWNALVEALRECSEGHLHVNE